MKKDVCEVHVRGFIESETVAVYIEGLVPVHPRHREFRYETARHKVMMSISPGDLGGPFLAEHFVIADSEEENTCVHEVARLLRHPERRNDLERLFKAAESRNSAGKVFQKILEAVAHGPGETAPHATCPTCAPRRYLYAAARERKRIKKMVMPLQ